MLSVGKSLEYLNKERLQEICREQDLKVSGTKSEIIAQLADFFDRNLATTLDCLNVDDLFNVAWYHFDEEAVREFVLAAGIPKRRRGGTAQPSETAKIYSTGRIGDTLPLDVAAIKADASQAVCTTVFSAYYVPSLLE